MKAAIVTAHLSDGAGGVRHAVGGLVQALCEQAVDVAVFGVQDRRAPDAYRAWGQAIRPFRELGPRALGFAPGMVGALLSAQVDVTDSQGLWMHPSCANLKWHERTRRPYVITPHGMLDPWAVKRASWKKLLVRRWFEDRHLARAACLRALCEAEVAAIRAFGLRNPVAVVPNGVDLPPRAGREGDRSAPVLLFLGRIDPKKRVAELVEAWSMLGAARGCWSLQITGWGEPHYVQRVRDLIEARGVQDSVRLTGPLFGEEKAAAFGGADAFVLPSVSEGLPMAVLEAWAAGLPVVMSDACNLPEGFAADAALRCGTDPASIAEALRRFLAMPSFARTGMGMAGRALVERRFTWPRVGAQMKGVYEWVLGGGAPPACVVTD